MKSDPFLLVIKKGNWTEAELAALRWEFKVFEDPYGAQMVAIEVSEVHNLGLSGIQAALGHIVPVRAQTMQRQFLPFDVHG